MKKELLIRRNLLMFIRRFLLIMLTGLLAIKDQCTVAVMTGL